MVCVLGRAALSPSTCLADDGSVQEAIEGAAADILKLVKGQPLSVNSQIVATGLSQTNAGPGIAELLKAALERIQPGVIRDKNALFDVQGRVGLAPHPDKAEAALGQKLLRLDLQVVNTETSEAIPLIVKRFIADNTTLIRFLQPSGPLPLDPKKDQREQRRERNPAIQEIIKNPRVFIDQTHPSRISTIKESPYQVEILAGPLDDGKTRPTEARPARIEDGLGFVDVKRGEVYEVRVYNHSPDEVAIRVFIDGLDLFHFSDDRDAKDQSKPKYTYLIVPPARDGKPGVETIAGWHKSIKGEENFLAFLVTEYGKGASSKAGIAASGPVGVIQVQFSRCYAGQAGARKRSAGNETGFGPPRKVDQEEVAREVEKPIDVVSVRYTR
jgi:hypothetical protein